MTERENPLSDHENNVVTTTTHMARVVTNAIKRRLGYDWLGLPLNSKTSPLNRSQLSEVEEWFENARNGIVAIQRSEGQSRDYWRDFVLATEGWVKEQTAMDTHLNEALGFKPNRVEIPVHQIVVANLVVLNLARLADTGISTFVSKNLEDNTNLGMLELQELDWPPFSGETVFKSIVEIERSTLLGLSGQNGFNQKELLKAGHFFDSLSRLG